MKTDTKKLVTLGMLSAVAFVAVAFLRIPMISFLSYEPKDVIITIGGFMFGPLAVAAVSTVVSLIEWLTISSTGIIGFVMNVLSTCSFACTAALIYKKSRTIKNAVLGLVVGTVLMTVVMLLWNYLITPLYLDTPREEVVKMLIPVFLPFNLIKGGLNAAITMLLYKPVVSTLRKAHLVSASKGQAPKKGGKISMGVALVSAFVIVTCVLIILIMQGVI